MQINILFIGTIEIFCAIVDELINIDLQLLALIENGLIETQRLSNSKDFIDYKKLCDEDIQNKNLNKIETCFIESPQHDQLPYLCKTIKYGIFKFLFLSQDDFFAIYKKVLLHYQYFYEVDFFIVCPKKTKSSLEMALSLEYVSNNIPDELRYRLPTHIGIHDIFKIREKLYHLTRTKQYRDTLSQIRVNVWQQLYFIKTKKKESDSISEFSIFQNEDSISSSELNSTRHNMAQHLHDMQQQNHIHNLTTQKDKEQIRSNFEFNTTSILNAIRRNYVFNTFGYDTKTRQPIHDFIPISPFQIEEIINSLQDFVVNVFHTQKRTHDHRKLYGRYILKDSLIKAEDHHPNSYLLYTLNEKDFFVILKSSKKIGNFTPSREQKPTWIRGTDKIVKLYALQIQFTVVESEQKYLLSFDNKIQRLITFTRPNTPLIGRLNITISDDPNRKDITRSHRHQLKVKAIEKLIKEPVYNAEFIHLNSWKVFKFTDPHHIKRILCVQNFAGDNLNHPHEIIKHWSFKEKIAAVLSLISELGRVLCEENTWPTDIKFENLCFQKHGDDEINIKFVDYITRTSITNSFLNAQQKRANEYSHPVAFIQSLSVSQYIQFCVALDHRDPDQRLNPTSNEFKLVAYHLGFELVQIIYWIFNIDAMKNNLGSGFQNIFSANAPFLNTPEKLTNLLGSFLDTSVNMKKIEKDFIIHASPFYSLLLQYTYLPYNSFNQTHIDTTTVLYNFFYDIRQNLFNLVSDQIQEITTHKLLIENIQHKMSDTWLNMISETFQNLPRMPVQQNEPKIFDLETI